METLRFLLSEATDGFRNMAADEVLLKECRNKSIPGALRVYQWNPPAVSLGYSQSMELIDLGACADVGVDVVRRITGGRAVLHWEEITYCFVARRKLLGEALWPRQFAKEVAGAVSAALVELGVAASVSSGENVAERPGAPSPLCFSLGMENEVSVDGRKLAGCAHKFTGEAYFSHGSIMLGPSHARIVELLTSRAGRADFLRLREGCVSFSDLKREPPSLERAGRALRSGFEASFGVSFTDGRLSDNEKRLIRQRALEKRSTFERRERSLA